MHSSGRQTEIGGQVRFLFPIIGIGVLPPLVTGVLEWLVLRRTLARAHWWIPASVIGFGPGGGLSRVRWGFHPPFCSTFS